MQDSSIYLYDQFEIVLPGGLVRDILRRKN